jgi:hypothetical protein
MKKKTNMRAVIRKIVREEVANAIGEVITELQKPTQPTKPLTPKKPTQNSSFTSNKVLNDVLNETANGEDWKTLGGGEFTSERMNELVGGQYGNMMKDTPQQVPSSDPMAQFLNNDYREVLQRTEEKSKQKYGK